MKPLESVPVPASSRRDAVTPLRIALVNNMPDSAFEETYLRFRALLCADTARPAELTCYALRSVPRSSELARRARIAILPVETLWSDPPDALVVTGSEPRTARLEDEAHWDEMAQLLEWASGSVPSVMLSCLAAHAALLALFGVHRVTLPRKQSGVYSQAVRQGGSGLAVGMGAHVALPHSRFNEVPSAALADRGFEMVVADDDTGWSVAVIEDAGRQLALLQGHPEYSRTALLKEYRRDVRRYLAGESDHHPDIPVGYLDEKGEAILEAYRCECLRGAAAAHDFPMAGVESHISADWSWAAHRLFANWVELARQRSMKAVR